MIPRPFLLLVSTLVLASAAFCQQASGNPSKDQRTFVIGGTVVEHATGKPLKRVLVRVTSTEHSEITASTVTSSDGRFAFSNVPAGKYLLQAQRSNSPVVTSFHGHEGFSTAIAVGAGLDSEHIVFPLHAPASISGTVLDEDNEPVRSASVLLFRKRVSFGRARITMQEQTQTDSSGFFHLGHLAPGVYFIAVTGHPWYAQNGMHALIPGSQQVANRSEFDVSYPLTYYGDSTEPASASPITLSEGDSAKLQIALHALPALDVELTGFSSQPNQGLNAMPFQVGPDGSLINPVSSGMAGFNDRWEITGLAPGRYVLELQTYNEGQSKSLGRKTIDLTTDSILDVNELSNVSISGQIRFEGEQAPNERPVIFLTGADGSQGAYAQVQPDGSFQFDQGRSGQATLLSGIYQVQLANAPGFYVKSIAAKGAKASGSDIEVPESGTVQLSIVAAKGTTRLDGIALKNSKPFAGAMVLLLPRNPNRSGDIRRDQSDSDGTFSLNDVPPGAYILVAIDDGEDLEYEDAAAMKPYVGQGQVVNVPLAASSKLEVNVLHRER